MADGLTCKFWGVRGSIPAPLSGPEYRRRLLEILTEARELWKRRPDLTHLQILDSIGVDFITLVGGETTCIEVRLGDEQLIVDLGTGARRLGYDMMVRKQSEAIHILLTGSYWDQIQGWPFFIPGYLPTSHLYFHSIHEDMERRFEAQQVEYFFPVEFQAMASTRKFQYHTPGSSFTVGPFEIAVAGLPHQDRVAAYRITAGGSCLVLAPDCAIPESGNVGDLAPFFEGAHTLVLDGIGSALDAASDPNSAAGGGGAAARLASASGAKRLVLTHHAPYRIEDEFRGLHAEAVAAGGSIDVRLAREGDEFMI